MKIQYLLSVGYDNKRQIVTNEISRTRWIVNPGALIDNCLVIVNRLDVSNDLQIKIQETIQRGESVDSLVKDLPWVELHVGEAALIDTKATLQLTVPADTKQPEEGSLVGGTFAAFSVIGKFAVVQFPRNHASFAGVGQNVFLEADEKLSPFEWVVRRPDGMTQHLDRSKSIPQLVLNAFIDTEIATRAEAAKSSAREASSAAAAAASSAEEPSAPSGTHSDFFMNNCKLGHCIAGHVDKLDFLATLSKDDVACILDTIATSLEKHYSGVFDVMSSPAKASAFIKSQPIVIPANGTLDMVGMWYLCRAATDGSFAKDFRPLEFLYDDSRTLDIVLLITLLLLGNLGITASVIKSKEELETRVKESGVYVCGSAEKLVTSSPSPSKVVELDAGEGEAKEDVEAQRQQRTGGEMEHLD